MTFHPYIFVETGFRHTGQPVWLIAVLERHRKLPVLPEITRLPVAEQIPKIQTMVVQHYESTGGQLEFWGPIQSYRYVYAEDQSIVFASDGTVQGQGSGPSSEATLTIKGKDLTKIIP